MNVEHIAKFGYQFISHTYNRYVKMIFHFSIILFVNDLLFKYLEKIFKIII